MANWQRVLNVSKERAQFNEDSDQHAYCLAVATKLREMTPFPSVNKRYEMVEKQRLLLADEFESMGKDPETDVPDVHELEERLFNWADQSLDGNWNGKKVCWVEQQL